MALFWQKQGQQEPHPKSSSIFFPEIKKEIISFQELLIYQNIKVLTEL